MAADLHCHTKLSDGSVGIEDLIVIAQKSGIDTIAITDHDCLAGTVRGKVIGKRYGVNVIPGVEISAIDNEAGKKVHILCYLADAPDRLEGLCKRTSIARKRAGQIMMLKVAGRFPITSDFIISHASGSTNLYKQHIMHALMDAGYTNEIFGDLFHALFSRESETNVLAPTKYPSIEEVLEEVLEGSLVKVDDRTGVHLDDEAVADQLIEILAGETARYVDVRRNPHGREGTDRFRSRRTSEPIEVLKKLLLCA